MIWCVEDDSSIRDIEVYALIPPGLRPRGLKTVTAFGLRFNPRSRNLSCWM